MEWMDDKPTELTINDIDSCFNILMNSEIKEKKCFTCGKGYYSDIYGHAFMECDECFFKRVPKEEREAFFRSFFE